MSRLFTNLKHVMSANAITGLANFLSAVWFARTLGPKVMGTYAVIVVTIQLLISFLTPGFNQAVIREPSKSPLSAAATIATFLQSLVMIGTSGAVFGIAVATGNGRAVELLIPGIGILASAVLSLWVYLLSVPFEATLDYRSLAQIRVAALAVSTATGVAAVAAGYGLNALVARDVVSALVSFVIIKYRSSFVITWKEWRDGVPDLIHFVRGLWPLNILERLVPRLDYAIVGWLFDVETLGIYFAVRGLVEGALGFSLSPVQTVLYAYYCRLPEIHSVVQTMLSRNLMTLMVSLTVGAAIALHIFGDSIAAAVLGFQYRVGGVLLEGLVVYVVAVTWFEHLKVLAMSQGIHHCMMLARLTQIVLSILLVFPMVRMFGLAGAGIASGIAAAAMAAIAMWLFACTLGDMTRRMETREAVVR